MHISGQSLLLLLLLALGHICDSSVILTAFVAKASNHVRRSQEVAIDTTTDLKLEIFINVPLQRANPGDVIILQVNLERTVEGTITAATSFGPDNVVLSGKLGEGKIIKCRHP